VTGPSEPIAVIDIGSNSGRVTVFRLSASAHLEIVSDARMPLRLARDVGEQGALGPDALERTVRAVRDFQAIARGAGAERAVAVATAAVRDASDADQLLSRIREATGISVEVIDGEQEAQYAFLGAVHGLPVESGLLFDIGGGSMELSWFRDRRVRQAWTLPLGSLQLSDRFLRSDPPAKDELNDLRAFVRDQLVAAGVPAVGEGEHLVGTGGTVRNVARVDERRHRYFIPHLHGYSLPFERIRDLGAGLAKKPTRKRAATPGLNADRADSIVGGILVVETLLDVVETDPILVSGQGLREGVALSQFQTGVAVPADVRRASVESVSARFSTWDPETAVRRWQVIVTLVDALEPDMDPERRELLEHAATLLDAGTAVDYYDRFQQAASIALSADLGGFSHRHVAILAAILREADGERTGKSFRPLLDAGDRAWVHRAGVLVALSEDVLRRTAPSDPVRIRCSVRDRIAVLEAPAVEAWQPRAIATRFQAAFHKRLVIRQDASP
jgi:exopolyphosphatase/guanosine-5'-triphosphate,3'-diphosphate pyrophosphatase